MIAIIFLIGCLGFSIELVAQTKKNGKRTLSVKKKLVPKKIARPVGDFRIDPNPNPASIVVPGDTLIPVKPLCNPSQVSVGVDKFKISSNEKGINTIQLVKPAYPSAAKAVRASGKVDVEVLIDENGNVICAVAINGHPLLRLSSEKAALETKFSPTTLEGKRVKVTGTVTYNFVAQ